MDELSGMTADFDGSVAAWTAYWRTGKGASCFAGPDIEQRFQTIWDEFVDALCEGVRLLDLATGNGTVAQTCAARARARAIKLQIDAIDAAQIDPPRFAVDPARLHADIRYRGGVRIEALPFSDASFHAVVSQFGFEYADQGRAVREVERVLAPGGRLRLVAHAKDGAASRDINQRLSRLRAVLDDRGPVALVCKLARALESGDLEAVARQSATLPAAAELMRKLADHAPTDDSALFYSTELMRDWANRHRYHISDLRRAAEDGSASAAGVASRYADLLRVARSAEEIATLADDFAAAGLVVDPPRELRDQRRGLQLAWLLDARKPGE